MFDVDERQAKCMGHTRIQQVYTDYPELLSEYF